MVVESTAAFCEEELAPLDARGDSDGCTWVDETTVRTPPGYKEAYGLYRQAGWPALSFPQEHGGQGFPLSLSLIHAELIAGACWTWGMFPGLSKGAVNTLLLHGSPELKKVQAAAGGGLTVLAELVCGAATGTMCLTEPGCGSDLGQVRTRAVKLGDKSQQGAGPRPSPALGESGETPSTGRGDEKGRSGSSAGGGGSELPVYELTGSKLFISCGEHDLGSGQIYHCVLARLPDAPPAAASPKGTRGLSLFLVPKLWRGPGIATGAVPNGVTCSRLEQKMGCHGSPTCQLEFNGARGWLIGAENKGMGHMFTFINTSRVGTALQGVAAAEVAFQNSLWYAKERMSMRGVGGAREPERIADPIIHHPQVRHMLLFMKAVSEGGRSLCFECAQLADLMRDSQMEAELEELQGEWAKGRAARQRAEELDERLSFLTPILKGFLTEVGKEAADMGIQVYGGHGYIKDNRAEQVYRDVRIAPVWEGTTQIQGLDFLGRKILRQRLKPLVHHLGKVAGQCLPYLVSRHGSLRRHARSLLAHALEWQWLTMRVAARALLKDREAVAVAADPYLMYAGHVSLASHWLKMEAAALEKMEGTGAPGSLSAEFYATKVSTSAFVFEYLLPRTRGLRRAILADPTVIQEIDKDNFSFDHAR
eukprot:CAMPEP_0172598972 /NCGR_PEP_ID=MMETSP1068-20121228/19086_1 /TAXON_ID=35684 /ORGANISM="Pseudopedinella elastica, Strain CCMP716" /LENGTH=648 /DNA_ID=CAMNT_0013399081 /DNA_START=313 /DNA_END=2259 /DNA_ORIENTATION=-